MNDEIIIIEELACDLLTTLHELYPDAVCARYGIEWKDSAAETLQEIAKSRGCFLKGESLDLKKASGILMDDFRSGRLGRITLECPDGENTNE
jgi:ribosome biogenesis GTPase A